jgi:AraC-like DNA-binding protein
LPRSAAAFLANPTARLVIDDWAEQLNMSRRAFTRAFRSETGISLSTWRQQAALFTALPRLAGGESVTTVAFDLGYESVAAFTTMFKRMLGAAPRAYFRTPILPEIIYQFQHRGRDENIRRCHTSDMLARSHKSAKHSFDIRISFVLTDFTFAIAFSCCGAAF